MAHFAKLDENNLVIDVAVVANNALDMNNEEVSGIDFLTNWSGGYTNWKQTSYNNKFRKRFAGIGYIYDATNDVFIEPQPYPSWSLDKNFDWQAPTQKPEGDYYWNELTLSWIELEA
jgi:hypothetical protein